MPPIWNDLMSMVPGLWSPVVAAAPTVGSVAPKDDQVGPYTNPTIVAFVRHCGCPFAENEIRSLAKLSNADTSGKLRVVVVCHSPEDIAKQWFQNIGGQDFKDSSRVKLIADPERKIYHSFGIGHLPFFGLFSRAMMTNLQDLRSKGVVNTETKEGSARWQNSGGLAVDSTGKVKWFHLAEHAGDMCNYEEAVKSLEL